MRTLGIAAPRERAGPRGDETARPTLLRNLLAIDLERRRAAGEQPQVQEPREARAPAVPLARGDADP